MFWCMAIIVFFEVLNQIVNILQLCKVKVIIDTKIMKIHLMVSQLCPSTIAVIANFKPLFCAS